MGGREVRVDSMTGAILGSGRVTIEMNMMTRATPALEGIEREMKGGWRIKRIRGTKCGSGKEQR